MNMHAYWLEARPTAFHDEGGQMLKLPCRLVAWPMYVLIFLLAALVVTIFAMAATGRNPTI